MTSIDHFDLRSFDLNLLVVFDALMEDRSVTKAAARLKVRQPAMSHSLSTLRVLLQDELLVRVGPLMQPTSRAETLAPRIRDALRRMQETLRLDDGFDPATQDRTFRLGFSSELEVLVLPDLTARLRQSAPGIRLIGRPAARAEVHQLLDDGQLDLAIGCYEAGVSRHRGMPLFAQALACCHNPALIAVATPIDVATYVATPHALVTLKDDLQGCLAEALARLGVTLEVVVAASDFLPVLAAAAEAPLLATVPARLAHRWAPRFGLAVGPVPLDLRVPDVAIVWSARLDNDPAADWLRGEVRAVLDAHMA